MAANLIKAENLIVSLTPKIKDLDPNLKDELVDAGFNAESGINSSRSGITYKNVTSCIDTEEARKDIGYPELIDPELEYDPDNFYDPFYEAPIHYAAKQGDMDLLFKLVEKGANVNLPCLATGMTPVMWAAYYGRKTAVEYLIEKGADPEYQNIFTNKVSFTRQNLRNITRDHNQSSVTTFLWTQYQKLWAGKEVNYDGVREVLNANFLRPS